EKTSKPSCVGIREKSSIKVNVWAAISCKGPTRFCLFTSNLNQYGYKYILEYYLLPYLGTKFSREELAASYFIQDNDPKHSSNLCTQFLRDNGVNWLRTPPNSADFNPIEMLWSDLKTFVRKRQCRSLEELTKTIREFETNLSVEKCRKLSNHLKKVLTIVANNKGDWSNE
ncbi:Transposable element Tcb2 transposase, partial [Brachionus plicatilis]